MVFRKPVRLGRQQHAINLREQGFVPRKDRVALRAQRGRAPADLGEHAGDIGVAGNAHPGILPNAIQHRDRWSFGRRLQQRVLLLERGAPCLGLVRHAKDATQQARQRQVVTRRYRVGDDQVRHESGQRIGSRLFVFVDIDDHVGRCQLADLVDVDVLGAAHLGNGSDGVLGVDAKAGAPHQLRRQAKIAQHFGNRGHQGNDTRVGRRRMVGAEGVSQVHGVSPIRAKVLLEH